jgi:hypothetical protein
MVRRMAQPVSADHHARPGSIAKRYVTQFCWVGPAKVSRSEILYGLVIRRLGGHGTLALLALFEPIALAIHL